MKKLSLFTVLLMILILSGCSSNSTDNSIDTSTYKEIGNIDGYTLYFTNNELCEESFGVTDATIWINYDYNCSVAEQENVYVLIKDNEQYDLLTLVENRTIDIEDLDELIEVKYFYPG